MAWAAPRTWVAGEIVTASIMNSAVRDNFLYIKGVGQVPTIQSGLTIDNSLGSERLLLPLLSTAECGTVLNAEGEVAFDETTHQMKEYDGTAVRVLISEADVDDTPVNGADTVPVSSNWAYDFQQELTTAGDVPFATAAGVWERLPIGVALQFLKTNAGATAPEWVTVTGISIASSTYNGNNTNDRQIATGFKCSLVLIYDSGGGYAWITFSTSTTIRLATGGPIIAYTADALLHATDGFLVDQSAANATGLTYTYVAIG
uniref:Tail protein n=1 Tax=viral metagenome TaxID=1070528 RepID=A0A6M3LDA0_9ZZZZ